ncbi:MAG: polyphosphate polymerase domain-containing protein [Eubacteriales bacterium]|jgi:hypothetical protein
MSSTTKYIDVFRRYETKYLLSERQFEEFMRATEGRFVPDKYGKSTISNIYFDTPDYRLIRMSLEKTVYKEKLRLRSYKTPLPEDTVFIELKKKYKGIVYKRRIDVTLADAEAYLYEGKPLPVSTQISREIDYVMNFYPDIGPACALFYDREAFFGIEDPNLRVTFDNNIMFRWNNLHLSQGPGGEHIIKPQQRIMELKTSNSIPLWLSHILDELKIYPTSFSKYGYAYQLSEMRHLNIPKKEILERKVISA